MLADQHGWDYRQAQSLWLGRSAGPRWRWFRQALSRRPGSEH